MGTNHSLRSCFSLHEVLIRAARRFNRWQIYRASPVCSAIEYEAGRMCLLLQTSNIGRDSLYRFVTRETLVLLSTNHVRCCEVLPGSHGIASPICVTFSERRFQSAFRGLLKRCSKETPIKRTIRLLHTHDTTANWRGYSVRLPVPRLVVSPL